MHLASNGADAITVLPHLPILSSSDVTSKIMVGMVEKAKIDSQNSNSLEQLQTCGSVAGSVLHLSHVESISDIISGSLLLMLSDSPFYCK